MLQPCTELAEVDPATCLTLPLAQGRGAAGQPVDGKPQVFWDGKPVPANASAAASAGSRLSPEQLQQAVTQQVQALTDQALAASRTPVHPGNSTGVGTAAQVSLRDIKCQMPCGGQISIA